MQICEGGRRLGALIRELADGEGLVVQAQDKYHPTFDCQ
jgi:hypothetical protein